MLLLSQVLIVTGLLSVGVVYGTDAFFAVVGRAALQKSDEASLVNVMGHLHEYGDQRMPLFGVTALVSVAALAVTASLGTPLFGSAASRWALAALLGLVVQLGSYLAVAKPVNATLRAAALSGAALPQARQQQRRWDSVIGLRTGGMTLAMLGLIMAAFTLNTP